MCILALAAGEGLDVALSLAVAGEEVTVVGSVDAAASLVGSFPVAVIDLGDTAGGVAAATSLLARRRVERCVVVGDAPHDEIPAGVSLLVRPLDMPELLTRVHSATGGVARDGDVVTPPSLRRGERSTHPAPPPRPDPTQRTAPPRRPEPPTRPAPPPRPDPTPRTAPPRRPEPPTRPAPPPRPDPTQRTAPPRPAPTEPAPPQPTEPPSQAAAPPRPTPKKATPPPRPAEPPTQPAPPPGPTPTPTGGTAPSEAATSPTVPIPEVAPGVAPAAGAAEVAQTTSAPDAAEAAEAAEAEAAQHVSPVDWLRRLRETRWWPAGARDRHVDTAEVARAPGPPPLEPAIAALETATSALAAIPALNDPRAVARAVIDEAVGRLQAEVAALWEVAESRLQPLDGVGLTANQARMPIPADQPLIAELLAQPACRLLDLADDVPPAALVRLPGLQSGRLLFVPLPDRPPVEAVLMLGGHHLGGDAVAWARTFAAEAARHVVFALRLRRLIELARADDDE